MSRAISTFMISALKSLGIHGLMGLSGPVLLDREREVLKEIEPAGVILFRKNLDKSTDNWIPALTSLLEDVRDSVARQDLIIAVDHEGGLVHRFFDPVTRFPAALSWRTEAAKVGAAMGRELRALGFTLNFAPVLDCWSEPQNTVIGSRAFSTNPKECAEPAIAFAEAMESQGVLSCGKHFAGHGATLLDSHIELPFLECSLQDLSDRELIPFTSYISKGFPLVMTSHVVYSGIDSLYPASLSRKITTDLLRKRLRFSGCVITDDLEMKALQDFTPAEIAVRALYAGADILLEGNPSDALAADRLLEMLTGVADALDRGDLEEGEILASAERIKRLFTYHAALLEQAPAQPLSVVGSSAHTALAARLTDKN